MVKTVTHTRMTRNSEGLVEFFHMNDDEGENLSIRFRGILKDCPPSQAIAIENIIDTAVTIADVVRSGRDVSDRYILESFQDVLGTIKSK